MKSTVSFKRGLEQVRRHWQAGKYDRALAGVNRLLENWPDNPQLLQLWAELVQLQDGDAAPSLAEAKGALERAAELHETAPEAWNELGHFLNAVEDDAQAASVCFQRAIDESRRLLRDGLLGQAQALTDLGRRPQALACIAEAYWLDSYNGKATVSPGSEVLTRLKELVQAD